MRICAFTCWHYILIIIPCVDVIMHNTISTAGSTAGHNSRSYVEFCTKPGAEGTAHSKGAVRASTLAPLCLGFWCHPNSLSLPMTLMGELKCSTDRTVPFELQRHAPTCQGMLPLRIWHRCENCPKIDLPRETV